MVLKPRCAVCFLARKKILGQHASFVLLSFRWVISRLLSILVASIILQFFFQRHFPPLWYLFNSGISWDWFQLIFAIRICGRARARYRGLSSTFCFLLQSLCAETLETFWRDRVVKIKLSYARARQNRTNNFKCTRALCHNRARSTYRDFSS